MHNEPENETPLDVEMGESPNVNTPNETRPVTAAVTGPTELQASDHSRPARRGIPGTFPGYADSMIMDPPQSVSPAPSAGTLAAQKPKADIGGENNIRGRQTPRVRITRPPSAYSSRPPVHSGMRDHLGRANPDPPSSKMNWRASGSSGAGATTASDAPTANERSSRCTRSLSAIPSSGPSTGGSTKRPRPQDDVPRSTSGSERKKLIVETPELKKLKSEYLYVTIERDKVAEDLKTAQENMSKAKDHMRKLEEDNTAHKAELSEAREQLRQAREAQDALEKQLTAVLSIPPHHTVATQTESDPAFDLKAKYDELRHEYVESTNSYEHRVSALEHKAQRRQRVIRRADVALQAVSVAFQHADAAHDRQAALAAITHAELQTQRDLLVQYTQTYRVQVVEAERRAQAYHQDNENAARSVVQLENDLRSARTRSAELAGEIVETRKERDDALESVRTLTSHDTEMHDAEEERNQLRLGLEEAGRISAAQERQVSDMRASKGEDDATIRNLRECLQAKLDALAQSEQKAKEVLDHNAILRRNLSHSAVESRNLLRKLEAERDRANADFVEAQRKLEITERSLNAVTGELQEAKRASEQEKAELQRNLRGMDESLTKGSEKEHALREKLAQAEEGLKTANKTCEALQRDQRKADADSAEQRRKLEESLNTVKGELEKTKATSEREKLGLESTVREVRQQLAQTLEQEKETRERLTQAEGAMTDANKARDEIQQREQQNAQLHQDKLRGLYGDLEKLHTRVVELEAGTQADNDGDDEMEVDDSGLSSRAHGKRPENRHDQGASPFHLSGGRSVQIHNFMLRRSVEPISPLKDRIIRQHARRSVTPGPESQTRRHEPITPPPSSLRSQLDHPAFRDTHLSTIPEFAEQGFVPTAPSSPSPEGMNFRASNGPAPNISSSSAIPAPTTTGMGNRLQQEDSFVPAPSGSRHQGSSGSTNHASVNPPTGGEETPAPSGVGFDQVLAKLGQLEQQIRDISGSSGATRTKSSRRTTFPFKKPQDPRPRSQDRTDMMAIVRKAMDKLLKIKTDEDIVDVVDDVLADPADVLAYVEGRREAPPLEPLRLYFDVPQHPWNLELGGMFRDALLVHHPTLQGDDVCQHFIDRIRAIRKVLVKHIARPGENEQSAMQRFTDAYAVSRRSSRQRRRQSELWESRIKICMEGERKHQPGWQKLHRMVNELGVDGQSSDESDGPVECIARVQFWRDPAATRLLRYIDSNRSRTNENGNNKPGARPRIRRLLPDRSNREVQDIAARLPVNLYEPTWYNSLERNLQDQLQAKPQIPLPELTESQAQLRHARVG